MADQYTVNVGSSVFARMLQPVSVNFKPLPDITAYELAQLMPLFRMGPIMPYHLPTDPAVRRHLEVHDPNKSQDEAPCGVAPSQAPSQHPDTILLDFIASEYLDVSAFAMPTGAGDADVGWKLVQEHEGKKGRVEVACHYRDDLRGAIREAMQALGYIPPDGVAIPQTKQEN
jgi:hypothetical protein